MIIIFSHAHPSISKGGAEVSAYTLYRGLLQLGIKAQFVAMCPVQDLYRVRYDTPNELVLPFQPASYDHFFHFSDPAQLHAILEQLTPLRPSAFIFHHFLFIGINTMRQLIQHFKVPGVAVLHEFLAICNHHGQMVTRPDNRLCERASPARCATCFPEISSQEFHVRQQYFTQTLQLMHRLVSPSQFLAGRFVEWGVPADQMAVIENGLIGYASPGHADLPVELPAVKRSHSGARRGARTAAKPANKQAGRKVVFGYFGQINPFKGIDQILDALEVLGETKNLTDHICVRVHGNVVGVSDAFRARFDAACQPGGGIDYSGPYVNADVHTLMQACDYVVMASKWWENSPVVIQEAYAAGRPVIVPALGGMAEKVIDGVTGHHFRPNDPADLAAVMISCSAAIPKGTGDYRLPRPLTARDMASRYLELLPAS